jgi:putative endonuclease
MMAGSPSHLVAGQRAEENALAYLQQRGFRLVERNYRCRLGEIDLVMEDRDRLVFVEVRYRASGRYGSALESIDGRKQARLVAAANHYLVSKRIDRPSRFDVVALSPGGSGLTVQWVKDAFQASET